MTTDVSQSEPIRTLTRIQRRVLGTLIEKGLTTPDQYPLTLKAATNGCNQKSNRDPVTSFTEDEVASTLDELREMRLVAEVFTDGGRAARYRHYTRSVFDFTEAQQAIMAELWLRGRQQPGELRTRASRMHRIDNQDQLRSELQALYDAGHIQATGPLDRRGVEVDHTMYLTGERRELQYAAVTADKAGGAAIPAERADQTEPVASHSSQGNAASADLQQLKAQIDALTDSVSRLTDRISRMESELGL